jgi:hypothetical protein
MPRRAATACLWILSRQNPQSLSYQDERTSNYPPARTGSTLSYRITGFGSTGNCRMLYKNARPLLRCARINGRLFPGHGGSTITCTSSESLCRRQSCRVSPLSCVKILHGTFHPEGPIHPIDLPGGACRHRKSTDGGKRERTPQPSRSRTDGCQRRCGRIVDARKR